MRELYFLGCQTSTITTILYFIIRVKHCVIKTGQTENQCSPRFVTFLAFSLFSWFGVILSSIMGSVLYVDYRKIKKRSDYDIG